MKAVITQYFINELFHTALKKEAVLKIMVEHLYYDLIPPELREYRLIFRFVKEYYQKHTKVPSFGSISQEFQHNDEVQDALCDIEDSAVLSIMNVEENLIKLIRDDTVRKRVLQIVDLMKEGKGDDVMDIARKLAEEITEISKKRLSNPFHDIYRSFEEHQFANQQRDYQSDKISMGIPLADDLFHGGIDRGDIALIIARSGEGKSTAVRWQGYYNSRLGYRVVHFQLEGSVREIKDKYNALWSGVSYVDLKNGTIDEEKYEQLCKQAAKARDSRQEITVYGTNTFGDVTMYDIRERILMYREIYGAFPDLILIDSLDLIYPGDGKYTRDVIGNKLRMQRNAQLLKNLATEINCAAVATMQAANVEPKKYNNPDFVLTRSDVEGDKTLIKPFDYVYSLNQTADEKDAEQLRIYFDKVRHYNVPASVIHIKTGWSKGRFIDIQGTIKYNEQLNKDEHDYEA